MFPNNGYNGLVIALCTIGAGLLVLWLWVMLFTRSDPRDDTKLILREWQPWHIATGVVYMFSTIVYWIQNRPTTGSELWQLVADLAWLAWAYPAGKIFRYGYYMPYLESSHHDPLYNQFLFGGDEVITRNWKWLAWCWGAGLRQYCPSLTTA